MECPSCKSKNIKEKLIQPIVYGGRNAIDYYWCQSCGIMFKETLINKQDEENQILRDQFERS